MNWNKNNLTGVWKLFYEELECLYKTKVIDWGSHMKEQRKIKYKNYHPSDEIASWGL